MDMKKLISTHWKNVLLVFFGVIIIFSILPSIVPSHYGGNLMVSSKMAGSTEAIYYDQGIARSGMYYGSNDFAPQVDERKITKNAQLSIESDNYDVTKDAIRGYISTLNGFIINENENEYNELKTVYFTIKVDNSQVDETLEKLQTYGEVKSLSIQASDVTQSFQDYSSRIKRLQSQIEKYESMLENENLEISEEIEINDRINQLEDQLYYLNRGFDSLNSTVEYSTISLTLQEKASVLEEIDFLGLKDGFKLFLNSINYAITVLFSIIGFVIPFAVLYGLYRLGRRFI